MVQAGLNAKVITAEWETSPDTVGMIGMDLDSYLTTMYLNQQFLRRGVKSLPIQGVIAIVAGLVLPSVAELIGMSLMAAHFHSPGIVN